MLNATYHYELAESPPCWGAEYCDLRSALHQKKTDLIQLQFSVILFIAAITTYSLANRMD
jgi:hypothetical protein